MSLGTILYRILIGPLELFFEVVFVIADRHVTNPAFAIIFLSLAMNFLVLPLYRRADAVQAEERDRENALDPWIKHIKKTFKGDERFMMLQAFYRENNYKPTDALKGSVSLLLEIPFFIAAYHFLSNLQTLRGVSFGPISDLGAPDELLTIGAVTLNLLPILMTLINVISAAIYMKGFPLKSKVQMYGIAFIFLVFLYKSPAGLVFYWTLNNLFSLMKNIFYKIPHPDKVLKVLASLTGAALLIVVLFVYPMPSRRAQAIVIAGLLCLQIPLLKGNKKLSIGDFDEKDTSKVFYTSAAFLTILTGVLIPSSVINDSTEEFLSIISYYSPYWYIVSALAIAFGTFVVWFTIFYRLASKDGKTIFSLLMAVFAIAAAVDYMFFGKNYGNFSSSLVFDTVPKIGMQSMLINTLTLVVVAVIISFVYLKKMPVIKALSTAMCLALIVMSGMNLININRTLVIVAPSIKAAASSEPEISLSKNGKNVVVIMMDRQIGHFVPFIMHEKPELKEQFSGFTFYANSFSYGNFTNVGSPALYGGFDYIPSEINRRSDESLEKKQNEALKVMPTLFSEQGFGVTVLDPTYAGYKTIPDLSVFDDMPEIKTGITNGRYSLEEISYKTDEDDVKSIRNRNFFTYSIFKISPLIIQPTLYDKGSYNQPREEANQAEQILRNDFIADGFNNYFMQAYSVLVKMPSLTKIVENGDTFMMLSNDTTHAPTLLQLPKYEPALHVDNSAFDNEEYVQRKDDDGNTLIIDSQYALMHYHSNVAAMIKLGEWLDFLKENNVYDNTRIIIVADHGKGLNDGITPIVEFENNGEKKAIDTGYFNCVMMVKDFESEEFSTDNELISNADTPAIAIEGLLNNTTNPFTGNKIRRLREQKEDPELLYTLDYSLKYNHGKKFLKAEWFSFKNNIYEKDKWKYLGYY